MTEVLGLVAYFVLPLAGWWVNRLDAVRRMRLPARIAAAAAAGSLIVCAALTAMMLLHVQWTTPRVVIVVAVLTAMSIASTRHLPKIAQRHRWHPTELIPYAFVIIAAYGVLSARMTSGDFSFFWQPKGVRFFLAGRIDVAFLSDPAFYLMHSDYPPLLPLIYAWSNYVSAYFAPFAAIFASVLLLAATIALVREAATIEGTTLFAAVLTYAYGLHFVAGGADPLLLLFETLALLAVTSVEDPRSRIVLGVIGAAGATLTKVEGAAFVVALIAAMLVMRKRIAAAAWIAATAVLSLGAWLAFTRSSGLIDAYGGRQSAIYFRVIPLTLRLLVVHARSDALWLPWVAPIAVVVLGRDRRRAALALIVSVLSVVAIVWFYIHDADPTFWIDSSANRTLLPPLAALAFAAAAVAPQRVEESMLSE